MNDALCLHCLLVKVIKHFSRDIPTLLAPCNPIALGCATLLFRDWLVFNQPKTKSCLSLFFQTVYASLSLTSGARPDATNDLTVPAMFCLTSGINPDATNGLTTDYCLLRTDNFPFLVSSAPSAVK